PACGGEQAVGRGDGRAGGQARGLPSAGRAGAAGEPGRRRAGPGQADAALDRVPEADERFREPDPAVPAGLSGGGQQDAEGVPADGGGVDGGPERRAAGVILLTHTDAARALYYGERAQSGLAALGDVKLNRSGRPLEGASLIESARGVRVIVADRAVPAPAGLFEALPEL